MNNKRVNVMIFENDVNQFRTLRNNLLDGFGADKVTIFWSNDGREVRNHDEVFIKNLSDNHLKEGSMDLLVIDLKMGERTDEFGEYSGIVILNRIFSILGHCRSVIVSSKWKRKLPDDCIEGYRLLEKWEHEEGLVTIDKREAGKKGNPLLRQIIASRQGRRILPTQVEGQIILLSRTHDVVLILGESGSGKEGIARAIHNAWCIDKHGGKDRDFFSLNAGALQYDLMRAELFGYAKKAFTGASEKGSAGIALQACGVKTWEKVEGKVSLDDSTNFQSTLFFDEIGNLSLPCQGLLLRFLEKPFAAAPLGHHEIHNVRPRIIAATNSRNWMKLATGVPIKNDEVRSDLFERVARHVLWVPPLFPTDVASLIRIQRGVEWTDEAIKLTADLLGERAIRGNIRGLINFIKRVELLVAQRDLGWEFSRVTAKVIDFVVNLSSPTTLPEIEPHGIREAAGFRTPNGNIVSDDQVAFALDYAVRSEQEDPSRPKDPPGKLVSRHGEARAELILLLWFSIYSRRRQHRGQKLEDIKHEAAKKWFSSTSEGKAHRSVQETAKSVFKLKTIKEVESKAIELRCWLQRQEAWQEQLANAGIGEQ